EDGIRDFHVTGVQTCALPILELRHPEPVLLETLRRILPEALQGGLDEPGRQLFTADLEEEVRHQPFTSAPGTPWLVPPSLPPVAGGLFKRGNPRASRCSRYRWAVLRARSRTRAIMAARSVTPRAPRASRRPKVWEHLST